MVQNAIVSLLVLAIVLPVGVFFISERRLPAPGKVKRFRSMLLTNVLSFFGVMIFAAVFLFANSISAAETLSYAQGTTDQGLKFLAAALSTGFATIGAGIATGAAASAALGALSENDSIMGRALIFVALAEGIAIYGLLISFMILGQ